jgi:polysaccharide export outer membrane protein
MKRFWIFLFCLPLLFSCRSLNPSIMFKTEKNYPYVKPDSAALAVKSQYRLAPFNELELLIYTNEGYKLVDVTSTSAGAGAGGGNIHYMIEGDGFVKLPLLGRVELKGMTVKEAEKFLEEKYAAYYNKPFLILRVLNRKVLVFKGEGGSANVVQLTDDNMSLIDAIAVTGGLAVTGKAYNIKLIRGDPKNPQVYKFDLSTIEGMKQSDLQLQANDIIYIEPTRNIAESLLVKISPFIGLLTTITLTIAIFAK